MMLRIALRAHRTGFYGTAAGGGFSGFIQAYEVHLLTGDTASARLAFAAQMQVLGRQISYLLPLPVKPETVGGYVHWRGYGFLILVLAFWAMISATGAVRGEEERGLIEQWLAAGVSRRRWVLVRVCAFSIVAAASLAVTGVATQLGAVLGGSSLPWDGLALESAGLLALTVCCFAVALLVAQFASDRRSAAGLAGVVLLALFLVNSLSRTADTLKPFRWISPFYFVEASDPIVPQGGFDLAGALVLITVAIVLSGASALAFQRRDLGRALFARPAPARREVLVPARNWMLRVPALAAIYEQRTGLFFWLLGVALFGALMASVMRTSVDLLLSNPAFAPYISALGGGDPAVALYGYAWFGLLQLLVAIYAVTQVGRWAGDDTEGRLEMILSAPVGRTRIVVERAATLAISCSVIIAAGAVVSGSVAVSQGIQLNAGDVLKASLLLLPFGLVFGALGLAVAGRFPRAAVPVLSGFAVASYFLQQVGPFFKWPEAVINLSVFKLYGTPLVSGVYWPGLWATLGTCLAGLTLALVGIQRRDVGH
jgi:ABC-2 type transport system permease protein